MISLKAIWHWFRLLFKDYSGAKKQIEDANALIPDEEVRRAMQLVRDLPDEQREFILDYVGGGLTPEQISQKYRVPESYVVHQIIEASTWLRKKHEESKR